MKIQIPTNCPCCDYKLELVNAQLFCRNSSCSAQLNKKLEHFSKVLGIKGLGPKSIEKLNISDITELYYLEEEDLKEALGSQKMAAKLLEELEKSKHADLATVLASFSIPLLGETAAKKIASVVYHIDEITEDKCKETGLGEKVTNNLLEWLETEFQELRQYLPFSFKSQNTVKNTTGKTVCITGKLKSCKTKAEAYSLLEEAGYRVVESVTKTLDILLDEQGAESSKRKKAQEYGIEIIDNLQTLLERN